MRHGEEPRGSIGLVNTAVSFVYSFLLSLRVPHDKMQSTTARVIDILCFIVCEYTKI